MITADPDATEATFAHLQREGHPANIGLRLRAIGLAVIDVDSSDGADALEDLVSHADLEQMPCAVTARGVHYFVRTEDGPGLLAPGLEIKSENVVAPPSLMPSGVTRSWVAQRELVSLTDVPPLPAALASLLRTRDGARTSGQRPHYTQSPLLSADRLATMLLDRGVPEHLVQKHVWGGAQ